MGFLSNVRECKKVGNEYSRNFDPAAQLRAASAQLLQMTQQASVMPSPTAVTCPAAVRVTGLVQLVGVTPGDLSMSR